MGQCYSCRMRLLPDYGHGKRVKDVVKAFNKYMSDTKDEVVWPGRTAKSIPDIAKILLAEHQGNFGVEYGREFSSGFDASYGWETVLCDAMERMAPFLDDVSYLTIDVDEGRRKISIENGRTREAPLFGDDTDWMDDYTLIRRIKARGYDVSGLRRISK